MAVSRKVHVISTKYFIYINWGYYVLYLQNIKFVQLIVWPGGAYTDNTYATKPESRSHIMIHFMNHDNIGSLGCIPNEPKTNIYRIGSLANSNATLYTQKSYCWSNDPPNILGVRVSTDMCMLYYLNYDTVLKKMQNVVKL